MFGLGALGFFSIAILAVFAVGQVSKPLFTQASANEMQHGGYRPVTIQTMALLSPVRNIDPRPATGGGSIKLVAGSALDPERSPAPHESFSDGGEQISLYVVREGDSLSQIATMFGVSVNTILWANELNARSAIRAGQELIILPVTGVRHTVAKGETIQSIAKQYKGDVADILAFNGLNDSSRLSAGEHLLIPGGEIVAPKPTSKPVAGGATGVAGLVHPVPGAVKTQGIHGYNGVDLAAAVGTNVRAAASGRVIVSKSGGWNGGYGNYIVIDHPNGTQTLYAHLSRNSVASGATVSVGQAIGAVGNTGRSTGAHLHFEVRGARNPF
jgi:LysM repeat protein